MSEWQPIETAPRNGERIRVFDPEFPGISSAGGGIVAWWDRGLLGFGGGWRCNVLFRPPHPTHWRPLITPEEVEVFEEDDNGKE